MANKLSCFHKLPNVFQSIHYVPDTKIINLQKVSNPDKRKKEKKRFDFRRKHNANIMRRKKKSEVTFLSNLTLPLKLEKIIALEFCGSFLSVKCK